MIKHICIGRLNSGNFRIFDFTDLIMNLDSLVCKAWKIISIDTKISMIPWESDIKNWFWNICVGVWVSGQPRANFLLKSKDALFNCASFGTSIVTEERRGIIVLFEKLLEKSTLRGLKLRRFDWKPINHNKKLSQNVENKKSNTMVVLIFKYAHAYS